MNISKLVSGSFFAIAATLGACALTGCAAESGEDVAETEDAVQTQAAAGLPSYRYVQVDQLTHRRISLSSNGTASVSVPSQGGTANPVLFVDQMVADFGPITQPRTASDLDKGALSKLAALLKRTSDWKADLAKATREIQSIAGALDKASNKGCLGSDWHVATFKDDMPDFVCGTLPGGDTGSIATLGAAKRPVAPAPAGSNTCSIMAIARETRSGDTVSLKFTRNGQDETIGGQWYSADGTPWEGSDPNDKYRCPDSACSVSSVRLTTSFSSVTYTATRLQGRKVRFITTGGSCVYGPY